MFREQAEMALAEAVMLAGNNRSICDAAFRIYNRPYSDSADDRQIAVGTLRRAIAIYELLDKHPGTRARLNNQEQITSDASNRRGQIFNICLENTNPRFHTVFATMYTRRLHRSIQLPSPSNNLCLAIYHLRAAISCIVAYLQLQLQLTPQRQ